MYSLISATDAHEVAQKGSKTLRSRSADALTGQDKGSPRQGFLSVVRQTLVGKELTLACWRKE